MSVSVINFTNAKLALQAQKEREKGDFLREKTKDFAFQLNNLVSDFHIDPVHQATLLMAKAIDVLVTAGPVPANLDEQHARAKNLLQSVIRARTDLMEKSVRIVSPAAMNLKMTGEDLTI
jgi:hypothetical protein